MKKVFQHSFSVSKCIIIIKAQQSFPVQECDATAAQQHSIGLANNKKPTCQRQMGYDLFQKGIY
mgnify:CR=1 FL=1